MLREKGRLDLSMEALVLDPQFHDLFGDVERAAARDRLERRGSPASPHAAGAGHAT